MRSEEETATVAITWETRHPLPPLMVSIHRRTRVLRLDCPREEFIQLEPAESQRLRSLPPGKR
jgi:hypothetical protein